MNGCERPPHSIAAQYRAAFERFKLDTDYWVRDIAARAVLNLALLTRDLDGVDAALGVFDEIEQWSTQAQQYEYDTRQIEVTSLSHKERMLKKAGRYDERLAVCEEMIHRFENDEDETRRFFVAHAAYSRAQTLGQLGDQEAQVAGYAAWIEKYGDDPSEEIRSVHANVLAELIMLD